MDPTTQTIAGSIGGGCPALLWGPKSTSQVFMYLLMCLSTTLGKLASVSRPEVRRI